IYDTFWENPRCSDSTISGILGPKIAATRLKMAYESGFVSAPDIRKKSYENLREYIYFIKCEDPEFLYLKYREDPNVIYVVKAVGFFNLWITVKNKMDTDGEIILEGFRSDYHVSYAPDRTWDTAMEIMQKRIANFDSKSFNPQHILENHFDETIDWDEEDELLYRYFKYDLRKPFTPLMREHGISKDKIDSFLNRLPNTCTIATHYYPESLPLYDTYLFMFETNFEDFIIDLFSELPSSVSFFKVENRLLANVYVPWQVVRKSDLQVAPGNYYIPLLLMDLLRKGIIKKKEYAILEYFWRKSR
ncbi:MAG: hypothetical protein HXS54_00495, partial [Theionarchaea archaeon]|nr:hypothetical protein [Theionarchaea archaeon]